MMVRSAAPGQGREQMKPRRVLSSLLLASIALVLLWIAFAIVWNRWLPPEWKYHRQMARAEALVREVEDFRAKQRRLPTSAEIADDQLKTTTFVNEPISIEYLPSKEGQEYEVTIRVGFDETHVYDPSTRRWFRAD
jgi:hypothetical protein